MRIINDISAVSVCFILLFTPLISLSQQQLPDDAIPVYEKKAGLTGTLTGYGSDTMSNLMLRWLEGFSQIYPLVNIQLEGKGSLTAPPALIQGVAQFGLMSRPMTPRELDAFKLKYKFYPVVIRTAMDALAVFVHRENPLDCISLEELDAIFSKTRKRGYPENITTWGQLGLRGEWQNRAISIYGRNTASGTYGVFKVEDLKRGDFKDEVKEQPGSASVVQSISYDRWGIGYSGMGYRTSDVKILKLAEDKQSNCIEGNFQNVASRTYPFSRYLYIYFLRTPGKKLDITVAEFLRFVLSQEGQQIVIQAGYFSLPAEIVNADLILIE